MADNTLIPDTGSLCRKNNETGDDTISHKMHLLPNHHVSIPADTQRKNNVIMTSKRRFDVVTMLLLRRVPVGLVHAG